ncbi:MAG: coniferyl aldehyde dehydrogenase [Filomicrobium sp.]
MNALTQQDEMTNAVQLSAEQRIAKTLDASLTQMKAAYARNPAPTVRERLDRLNRLHNAIIDYRDRLVKAVDEDFGGRASAETLMIEILPVLEGIHYNKKHLRSWMKQSKRSTPLMLLGAQAKVHYQPLGVIGIVVPWNFPIFLGLSPLVGALAAGNRAMLKTSEFAPRTGNLIKEMIAETFSEEEVLVVTGGVDVATEFTKQPFDQIVFTGSTQVGRIVMRAAADNLTPVTLELGGKSPAIIHDSFPIKEAAKRIAFGKGLNAGQVCVAPDYVLVPRSKVDAFIAEFVTAMQKHYPTMEDNPDYTSIITVKQRDRLIDNLRDAEEKGAEAITINPAGDGFRRTRKLPMTVLKNVTDDMRVMQEEIFGPILPVVAYDELDDAIAYVNDRDRPLALYYFDWNKARGERILNETHSGGVCINEVMTQTVVDDMPFGGIGPSGMGHYHGKEGFLGFSKAKGVVRKGGFNATEYIAAPWGNWAYKNYMKFQFWRFRKIR